ncbi:chloride channel protein [Actinomycetospora sp. OC33-EN08]|uniref:Chloride channel protein n=1 Tax=Actinomycetospora aurantiaca TaxID=3129233 RepID=A0ABU8MRQ5_9PSEU
MTAPRWQRLLGTSVAGLAAAAVVVGLGAGLGAVVFRELVFGVTRLVTGTTDYAATPGAPLPWWPELGRWFLLAAPVLGGLLYGPLVYRYAREARGHGVPEVMLAVAENEGRIRPRVAVVKSLASALTIGTGGSVGREGPIVQIGSAIGSSLGQWMRMPASRLRLLVACGAGGGIAATFNAPLSGVLFALEIILLDFTVLSVVVVGTSSVVANLVARVLETPGTFLELPTFRVESFAQFGLFALVGLVGALVGVTFTRVLYGMEDLADSLWRGPEWLRPAVGGLLVGLLLVALPEMYGVGYPVLQAGVAGQYAVGFLLLLLVGKMLATSLTLAVGGSGGIFAPSLFLGAMTGTALGVAADALAPGVAGPAGAYGLIGMAAVLAGATRAPITAVVIVAEITAEWSLVLPLLLAVALATALSRLLSGETVYTLKLARRGIHLTPPGARGWQPFGPAEVLHLPEERVLVRLVVPDDGWEPPPAFARLDGGAHDARMLLTGPADGLDALAASLPADTGR